MNETKRIIYLDLDGVLSDFRKGFMGSTKQFPEELTVDEMWKHIAAIPNFFLNLEISERGIELFKLCQTLGEVQLLTALPRVTTYPSAEEEKRLWTARHFGTNIPFVAVKYARQKAKRARPMDVLIDDSPENIRRWVKAGGIGIVHTDINCTIAALLKICGATSREA